MWHALVSAFRKCSVYYIW